MSEDLPADILSNTGLYWYWVSRGYWLILGGTGSVLDGTGWYLVELGRYKAVEGVE